MSDEGQTPGGKLDNRVIAQLDPLLEHKYRLSACVMLADTESITFSRFQELLGATNGNLGAQLRKLEDAKYVSVKKEFVGRRPTTWYTLTEKGKTALQRHLKVMQAFIEAAGD